jgi:phosphatidyl-myo-inositol dimannoside synthase
MANVALALGREQVCCLTAVPADKNCFSKRVDLKVYRSLWAFTKSKYVQAFSWGAIIAEIMIREQPKIVQLGTIWDYYLGLWLKQWFKLPFVVYAHGNEILAAMKGSWPKPRFVLQQADRVLANSHFTAGLVQQVGVDPKRIEVVHPGCDINHFRPMSPRKDLKERLLGARYKDQVLLTVSGLVARKGHDMVIRALPRLLESVSSITYLIVGDGPCRAQLESLCMSVGVREHVVFAGRIPDEDLPEIYALSNVFVMPSREQLELRDVEGFGIVFLEANACARPVIGGRSGGIPDAIVDGVTGLLVSPNDPEDIANAIKRLLTDRELAVHMGQQGHLRVVRDFNWMRIGERIKGILEDIVLEKSLGI